MKVANAMSVILKKKCIHIKRWNE